jgi:hypothetical protein
MFEHKQEKTLPLDISDEIQEKFIVVRNKHFTEYGG